MPKRQLDEEQKKALRERLAKGRDAAKARKTEAEAAAPSAESDEEHIAPPTLAVPAENAAPDAFEQFLARVDDETRALLPDAELREIFDEQQRRARAEKKAGARKRLAETALHVAKVHEGLLPQSARDEAARQRRMNELVTFRIELPPTGENGEIGDVGLRVDQRVFLHGMAYTVTRAEFDSMREILFRAGDGELMFEGKSRRYRSWMLGRNQEDTRHHIDLGEAA